MTTPTNGYVPEEFLATLVGSTVRAEKNTAAAYARLKAAHSGAKINGAAGGYWPRALDIDIHNRPAAYNVSASEAKLLAKVGSSMHGLGIRLNIGGITPAIAAAFGFSEFNAYTFTFKGPFSWDQPVVTVDTPTQRTVKTTGNVNRRTGPGTNFPTTGIDLKEGTPHCNFVGWSHGQDGTPDRLWFKGISGDWFVATAFTDSTPHDLPDLTPAPPVVAPPVEQPPVVVPPVEEPPATPPVAPSEPVTPAEPVTEPSTPVTAQPTEPPATVPDPPTTPTQPAEPTPPATTPTEPPATKPPTIPSKPTAPKTNWLSDLIAAILAVFVAPKNKE